MAQMDTSQQNDHDLLIRVDENVKNLILEIKDMRNGTSETLADHEARIRRLELWGAIAIGGLYVLNTLVGFYLLYKSINPTH